MRFITAIASLLLLSTACNEPEGGDTATVGDEVEVTEATGSTFEVDSASSTVRFEGYGVGKSHPGTFKINEGEVVVENNEIVGGEFVIDIRSMEMEEEGEMISGKLHPHLQSGDFFDAEKYPEAVFTITGVEPFEKTAQDTSVVEGANYRVSGNLKLKDETKNVSFPANIQVSDDRLTAKANFNIDRRDWKMVYGNDKSLGDKFISERVNIQLNVVGQPGAQLAEN